MSAPAAILSAQVSVDAQQAVERLTKFDAQFRAAQDVATKGIHTRLGASFDPAAFAAYESRLAQTARRARDRQAFKAELGANFNPAAFNAYERAVERARQSTAQLNAEESQAARSRLRGAASSFFTGSKGPNEERSFVRGTVRGAVGRGAGFLGGGLLGGLAGYLGAGAVKQAVDGTKELALETRNLTAVTGMDARTAAEWAGITKARGISARSFGMELKTLATATNGALGGSKASIQVFKDLGISHQQVAAGSHNLSAMFGLVADALQKMPPGAQKTADASKLLGRNWQQLLPILAEGSKGMDAQRRQASGLADVLAGKGAGSMRTLEDASVRLKIQQEILSAQFTKYVAPSLVRAEGAALRLAIGLGKDLAPAFKAISPIAMDVGHWLQRNKDIVRDLVIAFAGLKIMRVAGGWMGGLYNDAKRLHGVLSDLRTVATGGSARGMLGRLFGGGVTNRGATPTNPLYVDVINRGGVPGGAAAGEDGVRGALRRFGRLAINLPLPEIAAAALLGESMGWLPKIGGPQRPTVRPTASNPQGIPQAGFTYDTLHNRFATPVAASNPTGMRLGQSLGIHYLPDNQTDAAVQRTAAGLERYARAAERVRVANRDLQLTTGVLRDLATRRSGVTQTATALDSLARQAQRAGDVRWHFADRLGAEMLRSQSVSSRGVRALVRQLDRLSPGARAAARTAMVQMAQSLERSGAIPKGSSARLVAAISGDFRRLQTNVHRSVQGIAFDFTNLGTLFTRLGQTVAGTFNQIADAVGGARTVGKAIASVAAASGSGGGGWNIPTRHRAAARSHHRAASGASSAALRAATRAAATSAARSAAAAARRNPATAGAGAGTFTAPSQTIAAQIRMAELQNAEQVAQNAQNTAGQQRALNAELKLEKLWLRQDKQRLAHITGILHSRGLSAARRSQLQQNRLAILQEIGNVAGQIGSTMSSLSSLTGGGSAGSFDLAPGGGQIPMPTVYDVRRSIAMTDHGRSQRVAHEHHHHHHHGSTNIYVDVRNSEDVPKVADVLDRHTGSTLHARLRSAGMRGT